MSSSKTKTKKTITRIFYIIQVLVCLWLLYCILHLFCGLSTLYDENNALMENINNLSSEYNKLYDDINSFNKGLDNTDGYANKISGIDKELSELEKENYIKQSEYDKIIETINSINKIINDNTSEVENSNVVESIEEYSKSVLESERLLTELSDEKEDKINKVDEIVDSESETEFPNVKAFNSEVLKFYDAIYPVGSFYISINGEKPSFGTWEQVQSGRVLWNTENGGGGLLDATLPNVTGGAGVSVRNDTIDGPFYVNGSTSFGLSGTRSSGGYTHFNYWEIDFDMSRSSGIYQKGATVRPNSIVVAMFKRVS